MAVTSKPPGPLLEVREMRTLFVPALIESLKSPDEAVRENAKRFLKRNDPEARRGRGSVTSDRAMVRPWSDPGLTLV